VLNPASLLIQIRTNTARGRYASDWTLEGCSMLGTGTVVSTSTTYLSKHDWEQSQHQWCGYHQSLIVILYHTYLSLLDRLLRTATPASQPLMMLVGTWVLECITTGSSPVSLALNITFAACDGLEPTPAIMQFPTMHTTPSLAGVVRYLSESRSWLATDCTE
jgi:hypothetical protein